MPVALAKDSLDFFLYCVTTISPTLKLFWWGVHFYLLFDIGTYFWIILFLNHFCGGLLYFPFLTVISIFSGFLIFWSRKDRPIRKWLGVNGSRAFRPFLTGVRGQIFMIISISTSYVYKAYLITVGSFNIALRHFLVILTKESVRHLTPKKIHRLDSFVVVMLTCLRV